MNRLTYLLVFLLLFACGTEEIPAPSPEAPPVELDINLEKLSSNYLSLDKYSGDTVVIGGQYEGDRIVLKDASEVYLKFHDCTIRSTHSEDALVFGEAVSNTVLDGRGLHLIGGGITFWSSFNDVQLYGGRIDSTHTGIRATQEAASRHILISGWSIAYTSHEGIYIGPSKASETKVQGVVVTGNKLFRCGWDGIQIGNCGYFVLYDNIVWDAGLSKEYGQDYGVTINPGSLGYCYNNQVTATKPMQVLDSRVFFHAPVPPSVVVGAQDIQVHDN